MTISLKHAFSSVKADGTDSTLVQPSNWNAEHTVTLAAGKVLGRDSSGAGAMQELPLSFDTSGNMSMSATGSFIPAVGTTGQRPASPTQGMVRFNTTSTKVELYNGTVWGSVGGGATISDTAPSSPSAGDLWWKSDEGQMYVYYTDANSSQWVVANAYAGGAAYLPLAGGTLTGTIAMTAAGAAGTLYPVVQGTAQASTIGTSITFSSIPSWVKRITVMFTGVSTSGTSNYLIQVGSGSVTTSGYLGSTMNASNAASPGVTSLSSGFTLATASAANVCHGALTIYLLTGNTYIATGNFAHSSTTNVFLLAGTIALSGVLDRVVITTVNGTDTFDAGSINILYE
jgi:hypothetical protein